MRGISLDEIATATKISSRNLRALEEEKFKQLPGGIFNKGFVRAYAKFLGIDEDQMVAEYVTASQDTEAAREQKFKSDLSKVDFRHDDEEQREISLEPKSQWGTVAVIVLIGVLVFSVYEYYQKQKAERQLAQAQAPTVTASVPQAQTTLPATTASTTTPAGNPPPSAPGTVTPTQTPTASSTTGSSTDVATPAAQKSTDSGRGDAAHNGTLLKEADVPPDPSNPIDVKIHANQQTWVSITADGKPIVSGMLAAQSEKAVRARDKVVVVLGNAGGVEVSYNGKPLELGKPGEVKKITFTPTGYE